MKNGEHRTENIEKRKVSINSVVLTVLITFENILSNNNTTCKGNTYTHKITTNPFADKSNILSQGKLISNDKNETILFVFTICLPQNPVSSFSLWRKNQKNKQNLKKKTNKTSPSCLYLMDFCFDSRKKKTLLM